LYAGILASSGFGRSFVDRRGEKVRAKNSRDTSTLLERSKERPVAKKAKKTAKKAPARAAKAKSAKPSRKPAKAARPARAAARRSAKPARAKKVQPIPPGYRTITPYLVVKGVGALIDFLKDAVSAKERYRMASPDGTVMHAELKIGDSMLMLGEFQGRGEVTHSMLYLYVKDCDRAYAQAIQAGGESVMEPTTQFYGDRSAAIKDPMGNQWWFGTHVEDVSPKEMARRAAEMYQQAT
jgi:PhnB protein